MNYKLLLYEDIEEQKDAVIESLGKGLLNDETLEILWFDKTFPDLSLIHCPSKAYFPLVLSKEKGDSLPNIIYLNSKNIELAPARYNNKYTLNYHQSEFDGAILDIYSDTGVSDVGSKYVKWFSIASFNGPVLLCSAHSYPTKTYDNLPTFMPKIKDTDGNWLNEISKTFFHYARNNKENISPITSVYGYNPQNIIKKFNETLLNFQKQNEIVHSYKSVFVNFDNEIKALVKELFDLQLEECIKTKSSDKETILNIVSDGSNKDIKLYAWYVEGCIEEKHIENLICARQKLRKTYPPVFLLIADKIKNDIYTDISCTCAKNGIVIIQREELLSNDFFNSSVERLSQNFDNFKSCVNKLCDDEFNRIRDLTHSIKSFINSIINTSEPQQLENNFPKELRILKKEEALAQLEKINKVLPESNILIFMKKYLLRGSNEALNYFELCEDLIKEQVSSFDQNKFKFIYAFKTAQEDMMFKKYIADLHNSLLKVLLITKSIDRISGTKTTSMLPWISGDYPKHKGKLNTTFSKNIGIILSLCQTEYGFISSRKKS